MSNVFSLSDLKGHEDDSNDDVDDKDKRDRQTYYAGGAKSGVAIVGPNKDSNSAASVADKLFDGSHHSDKDRKVALNPGETLMHVTVTLYSDSLTYKLDEAEPVRLTFEQQECAEFITDLMNDKLPQELRAVRAKDGSVPVFDFEIIDKRKESMKVAPPEPKKPATFTGEAHSTGGTDNAGVAFGACGLQPVTVDGSKPCTNVQVRLPNGRRVVGKFNPNEHTIADLRRFIDTNPQSAPVVTGKTYEIVAALPPRPLTDLSQSLQDAKLCNAAVNVRIC